MGFIETLYAKRKKLADVLGDEEYSGIRQIVEELYPDRAHFIYELLQNAEDAGASDASFFLDAEKLVFEHNGRTFDERDVEAITNIGRGTKGEQEDKIGRFGIGFKAVFAYSETPHIWSPTFSFKITDLVLPLEIPPNPQLKERTRFEFPFNSVKKSLKDAYDEIKLGLAHLAETTLLFLSDLESIQWQIGQEVAGEVLRIEHPGHHIEVLKQINGETTSSAHFLRFSDSVDGLERQRVAIAFELDYLSTCIKFDSKRPMALQFKIVPATPGTVSVYFPAEKEVSGLRFHLHAPFVPELSRASIKETPANRPLYEQLAQLAASSLRSIRDLGFLTGDFLGVLPIDEDNVPESLQTLCSTVRGAFISQPLVPTNGGEFAPASCLAQGPKTIRDVITDPLFPHFSQSNDRWATGVLQNSRSEKFLLSLGIPYWSWDDLDSALDRMFVPDTVPNWFKDQKDDWIRRFYQLLYHLIHDRELGQNVKRWSIILTALGEHVMGSEAYFPDPDSGRVHRGFHVVKPCLLSSRSLNNKQRKNVRDFLERAGVRDITERERIERILDSYYLPDARQRRLNRQTHLQHMRRFVRYAHEHGTSMFQNHVLFWDKEGGTLRRPENCFLDKPFAKTGLGLWYSAIATKDATRSPLWVEYAEIQGFTDFAISIGTVERLRVEMVSTRDNPSHQVLHAEGYAAKTERAGRWVVDEDYTIPGVDRVLKKKDRALSQLVWNAMCSADASCLTARYALSRRTVRQADSTIVHILRATRWIPDKAGRFCKPENLAVEKLAAGFHFIDDNGWLTGIGFGEAARRRFEVDHRQQEVADELGITPSMMKLVELLKRIPDDQRNLLIDECTRLAQKTRARGAEFPDHAVSDHERRQKKIASQLVEAPGKQYERRERSVRISQDPAKRDVNAYLRSLYTNDDGLLICQICKEVMPFRKRDGKHYFERVEAFDLLKEHEANSLALCPVCAAKYNEFIKHDSGLAWGELKGALLNSQHPEVPLILGAENASVRFVDAHFVDLKAMLETLSGEMGG